VPDQLVELVFELDQIGVLLLLGEHGGQVVNTSETWSAEV
jgi:hypothetical protein